MSTSNDDGAYVAVAEAVVPQRSWKKIKCKHETVVITAEITKRVVGRVHETYGDVLSEEPVSIRASVSCKDCQYVNVLTTFSGEDGTPYWDRWPKWLVDRMIVLAQQSSPLRLALRGLNFPHKIPY